MITLTTLCTIDHNTESRRVTVLWDNADKHLYARDLNSLEQLDETAETLDAARALARALWGNGWNMEAIG